MTGVEQAAAGSTPAKAARKRALHPAALLALFLAFATLLRWDTFGDPNMHGDEVFYHTVGLAMHHGAIPYVDVWDRKPFGLFTLFYLIGFLSENVIAYQITAAIFATGTAFVIAIICRELDALSERDGGAKAIGPVGALLAGPAYLLWLAPLGAYGGQSPIWYNLFIASACWLVVRAIPNLRDGRAPASLMLAMLLAGTAITIKQTSFFEAAFIGLYPAWLLRSSGIGANRVIATAGTWALIGAAPALAIAFGYAAIGHWNEYWQAMVLANLDKPQHWPTALTRAVGVTLYIVPLVIGALIGLRRRNGEARKFLTLWLLAAVIGLCSVPQFYMHYALPLTVPLAVAASGVFSRGILGLGIFAAMAIVAWSYAPWQLGHAAASRAAIDRLQAATIRHLGEHPLLLYDAPPQLYRLTGQPLITPLVFPTHLAHAIERDMSSINTLQETRRLLALNPSVVVLASPPRNAPINKETYRLVLNYVEASCREIETVSVPERERTDDITVWGDCAPSANPASPPSNDRHNGKNR